MKSRSKLASGFGESRTRKYATQISQYIVVPRALGRKKENAKAWMSRNSNPGTSPLSQRI